MQFVKTRKEEICGFTHNKTFQIVYQAGVQERTHILGFISDSLVNMQA